MQTFIYSYDSFGITTALICSACFPTNLNQSVDVEEGRRSIFCSNRNEADLEGQTGRFKKVFYTFGILGILGISLLFILHKTHSIRPQGAF